MQLLALPFLLIRWHYAGCFKSKNVTGGGYFQLSLDCCDERHDCQSVTSLEGVTNSHGALMSHCHRGLRSPRFVTPPISTSTKIRRTACLMRASLYLWFAIS